MRNNQTQIRELRAQLLALVRILARPLQQGGEGMADSADSPLSKLAREIEAAQ